MENIAPLLQTILWVGLLGTVLWRFHEPLHGLLVALQRRVEGGSNIKAGPFELTDVLKPQDPTKQKEKAASEVAEVLEAAAPPLAFTANPPDRAAVRAKYFQAEDLVLRAIQAEYGATVSRQVTAGADIGFDGAFVSNGRMNIVEVKYFSGDVANTSKFRSTIDQISGAISRYGWKNAQIIFAVVLENPKELEKISARLQDMANRSSIPVIVKCYSFAELQQKFGVAELDRATDNVLA